MKTTEHCGGCRDDFYNTSPLATGGKCWNLKSAKMVTRYRIGYWTEPTVRYAFKEVRVPSCYYMIGYAFYEKLPDFVKTCDVVRLTREHAKGAAMKTADKCPTCGGSGMLAVLGMPTSFTPNPRCWDCKGTGKLTRREPKNERPAVRAACVAVDEWRAGTIPLGELLAAFRVALEEESKP